MRRAGPSPVKADVPLPGPTCTGRGLDLAASQARVIVVCAALLTIVFGDPGIVLPADQAGAAAPIAVTRRSARPLPPKSTSMC